MFELVSEENAEMALVTIGKRVFAVLWATVTVGKEAFVPNEEEGNAFPLA